MSLINLLTFSLCISTENMNSDVYKISNLNFSSPIQFSTNYNEINSSYEYFDVYSPPITSRYGDVYWTMMDDVKLPDDIITRFQDKYIAIVGYESDQIFKTPNGDVSVPITWSYNHHYGAFLQGAYSQLIKVDIDSKTDYGAFNHGAKQKWMIIPESAEYESYINSQFFSEGNGGESRASFHGYPNNYAQLVYSPMTFRIQPMQIDTRNRDIKYINDPVFHSSILPKNTGAPMNASYSGLLECPCTTRINKTYTHEYNSLTNGYCSKPILDSKICYKQGLELSNTKFNNFNIINESSLPYGCSFRSNNDYTNITFNQFQSKVKCGQGASVFTGKVSSNVSLILEINTTKDKYNQVVINVSGPADKWFGLAFNAYTMQDLPYTIIFNGTGEVFEVKLGNHDAGTVLNKSINVLENNVIDNTRYVSLSRSIIGNDKDYYTFDTSVASIPLLEAIGYNTNYAYHQYRNAMSIDLKAQDSSTCICDNGISGKINGITFSKRCAPEPVGDLLKQKNPSCFLDTYQGGLSCCHHKNILLDIDQEQPTHEMTYHLKFRFWFQDYYGQKKLIRLYFQTEAYSGEYDIPKCEEGTPPEECIHSITARWTARNMVNQNDIGNTTGVYLIYAGPHCHAPTCISMELYNADTGDILCRVVPDSGSGNTSKKYDEKDYIKLDPCVWGYDKGLLEPPFITWDTNLTSIKKNNNTYAHYGEMASWQMRGSLS